MNNNFYSQQNNNNNPRKDMYYDINTKFTIMQNQVAKFPTVKEQTIMTDTQLASSVVNPIFSRVYKDYYGSIVNINPRSQQPEVTLIFRPGTSNFAAAPYQAFEPMINKHAINGSPMERQMRLEMALSSVENSYKLTSDGEEGIVDYFIDFNEKHPLKQIFKGRVVDTLGQSSMYGMKAPMEKHIVGLSLQKMIKFTWGEEEEEKPIYYLVEFNPYTTVINSPCKWVFTISRMTAVQYEKVCNTFGVPGLNNVTTTVTN